MIVTSFNGERRPLISMLIPNTVPILDTVHQRVLQQVFRWLSGCVILLLLTNATQAQFGAPFRVPAANQGRENTEFEKYRRIPRDPLTHASYIKALQAIEENDVTLGLETLQAILDEDRDFFLIEEDGPPQSLFRKVELLIREHQQDYERLFGPIAKQQLLEARSEQNLQKYENLVRNYSLTNAGAEGLRDLAQLDHDRGDVSRGARELEQLASHPTTQDAKGILLEAARWLVVGGQTAFAESLLHRHPDQFPDVDQVLTNLKSSVKPSVASAANARMFEWRTPYGDVSQTGQTGFAPAFSELAWRSPLIDDDFDFPALMMAPDVSHHLANENRELTEAIEKQLHSPHTPIALPAGRPLIVNDLVIVSGPGSVKAFDLKTGRLAWNGVDIDETFDYLAKQTYSPGAADDPVREEMRELFAAIRGWRDLTATSISTDGRQVYAVSNCQLVGTTSPRQMLQNTQRHALLPQRSNSLTAYLLPADGKKMWSIGTPSDAVPITDGLEPREMFFLGAPLPVDGHLYALGEERGQTQVVEIDPATGSILWSLGLLNPDLDLILDENRRLAGLMPAYHGGLLVCPNGEGGLTAVDPLKRQVVWTHSYADTRQPVQNQALILRMMRPQNQSASQSREEMLTDQRWFDSRIIIADDTIIYTPPDSDSIICLHLQDGTPVWETPLQRMQMLYAGGIYQDQLILVGRSEIKSIHLKDGSAAWKSSVPIPEPSGRGLRMGNQFLQPLRTGDIAVIDLPSGRLLTRLPLPEGQVPGNLVADRGTLVMQTGTGVTAFQSLASVKQQIASQLQSNSQDPQALALRGEWRLQQGNLQAGLSDLQQSLTHQTSPKAQKALAWSLLDGLRTDFAAYRQQADQIEQTLNGRDQRLQFLRTYARGLQRAGENEAACRHYLQILEILPAIETLKHFDSDWAATDSRWVLARLSNLFESADAGEKATLREILSSWVRDTAELPLLLRILPAFPSTWVDPIAIVDRLKDAEPEQSTLHYQEAILRGLYANRDESIQSQAAALLLKLALFCKDAVTVRQMLATLEARDVPIADSTYPTSFKLAAAVRGEGKTADLIHNPLPWSAPISVVENVHGTSRTSTYQIPLLGSPSPSLEGWTFFLDQGGVNIEIYDQNGEHRNRVPTSNPNVRYAVDTDLSRYASMHNHLVLIVLIDRFLILDLLSDPLAPQLLVKKEFQPEEKTIFNRRGPLAGPPRVGLRSMQLLLRNGQKGSNVGPLTDSLLCYGSGSDLIAINPATGKELWRRRDIPEGAEIFGDERFVVLKPVDGSTLQILNALDGSRVSTCELPEGAANCLERRHGDWGRMIPIINPHAENLQWDLFDPVTESPVWSEVAAAGTRWTCVNGQHVAFYSPDQQLTIREGLTGRTILETEVSIEEPVEEITVLEFPDQWILFSNSQTENHDRRQLLGLHAHELLMAQVNGTVTALDRKNGQSQWTRNIPNQELVTQAPVQWPLLLFGKGRGRMESLIMNRTSGEIIRQRTSIDDGSGVSWSTETHPLSVQLKFANDRVKLVFGSAPTPEQPTTAPPQTEEDVETKSRPRFNPRPQ